MVSRPDFVALLCTLALLAYAGHGQQSRFVVISCTPALFAYAGHGHQSKSCFYFMYSHMQGVVGRADFIDISRTLALFACLGPFWAAPGAVLGCPGLLMPALGFSGVWTAALVVYALRAMQKI